MQSLLTGHHAQHRYVKHVHVRRVASAVLEMMMLVKQVGCVEVILLLVDQFFAGCVARLLSHPNCTPLGSELQSGLSFCTVPNLRDIENVASTA